MSHNELHETGGWRSRTFVENSSPINSNRCVKTWSTYRSQNSRPSYYRNNGSKLAKYLSLFNSRGLVSKVVGCCAARYMWIVLRSRCWARSFNCESILLTYVNANHNPNSLGHVYLHEKIWWFITASSKE